MCEHYGKKLVEEKHRILEFKGVIFYKIFTADPLLYYFYLLSLIFRLISRR